MEHFSDENVDEVPNYIFILGQNMKNMLTTTRKKYNLIMLIKLRAIQIFELFYD